MTRLEPLQDLINRGGPVMARLALLSVHTRTVILWKTLTLWRHGAFFHHAAWVAADRCARNLRPNPGGAAAPFPRRETTGSA